MSMTREELNSALQSVRSRAVIELIEDAYRLGWTIQTGKHGVMALHSSAYPTQSLIIPREEKSVRDSKLRAWHRKIRTYADPSKLTEEDKPLSTVDSDLTESEKAELDEEFELSEANQAYQEELERGPVTGEVQEEPVLCDECQPGDPHYGRDWGGKHQLSGHKKWHRRRDEFQCYICGAPFPSGPKRGAHMRNHHPGWNKPREDFYVNPEAKPTPSEEKYAPPEEGVESDLRAALELIVETAQDALGTEGPSALRERTAAAERELAEVKRELVDLKDKLQGLKGLLG